MKIVFETRFSFFGQGGWRSPASKDPGMLFDPDRLNTRLDMFERYTLAGLAAQSDPEFHHVILSSEGLPDAFKDRLNAACAAHLEDKATVIYRPQMSAGQAFRDYIRQTYKGEHHVAQVVLDDDDALSFDFVAALRYQANCVICDPFNNDTGTFISFPRGLSMGLEDGAPAWLSHRNVPYTNLGLALIAPPSFRKNPYMTSHRKIGLRHASHLVGTERPFYVRAVHDHNDSRAIANDAYLNGDEIKAILRYFPFLESQISKELQQAA